MQEQVILVNKKDEPIGLMDKFEAHEKGALHRAVSVFIFNSNHELLIQRRALAKYHTPGIWSNTACSHPRNNESTLSCANRRLFEEMGIKTEMSPIFSFLYKAEFSNNLIEHELDHVFIGFTNKKPNPNPKEVCDWKYIDQTSLEKLFHDIPDAFSPWFKICYTRAFENAYTQNSKELIHSL
ncbi:MAG: isopentenyl-diphosphate Delta-isomerase [Flavobacteriales bacterium]|nr:isopentenyl-diphosphate Delta-isomerase [Flavobacteriales bacterium]